MMLNRCLPLRRANRKRTIARAVLSSFRFEMLEPRTCMANDLDISSLSTMPLSTAGYDLPYQQPAIARSYVADSYNAYSGSISRQQIEEVICLVPPTSELFSLKSELCIDASVGPRQTSVDSLLLSENSGAYAGAGLRSPVTYRADFSVLQWKLYAPDSASYNALDDSLDSARPKIVDVPQVVVGETEGEGDDPPTITTQANEPESPVVFIAKAPKHVEVVEQHSPVRKASFIAAVDWIHGSRSNALVSLKEQASEELVTQVSGHETADSTKQVVASQRNGWLGLLEFKAVQPIRTDPNAQDASDSEVDDLAVRPMIAALPGLDAQADGVSELPDDAIQAAAGTNNSARPGDVIQRTVAVTRKQLAVRTLDEATEALPSAAAIVEAGAWPPGVWLSSEENSQSPSVDSWRTTRYWYLAAIPAFFALPRRVRDRLPSVPRLKRA